MGERCNRTAEVRGSIPLSSTTFRRSFLETIGGRGCAGGLAEREGFEPSIRFCRILTFQASAFDHSATAPHVLEARLSSGPRTQGQAARPRPFGGRGAGALPRPPPPLFWLPVRPSSLRSWRFFLIAADIFLADLDEITLLVVGHAGLLPLR
jgi:hypothetical protein